MGTSPQCVEYHSYSRQWTRPQEPERDPIEIFIIRIFFPKLFHLESRHLLGQGNDGEHAGDVHPDGLGQVLVEADCGSAVEHNVDLGDVGDQNRDHN